MADITMCKGVSLTGDKDCPIRQKCFRYLAPPEAEDQTYFINLPYNFINDSCEFFWDTDQENDGFTENSGEIS